MNLLLACSSVKSATNLHQGLLINIMHLPMQFFESTPLGRIVNRFSKDINSVDDKLPPILGRFLRTLLTTLGTICVISYSTPLFLTCVAPLAVLYIFIQVRYEGLMDYSLTTRYSIIITYQTGGFYTRCQKRLQQRVLLKDLLNIVVQ